MAAKIRIKDIAQRAGVSAGTVDRVLHNRPSVSKASFEKVKKVMEEMNYTPNMYASALACNRSYTFCVIMPKHSSEAYWDEIEEGTMAACKHLSDFNVDVKIMYYERLNTQSFNNAITECLSYEPQGVIMIPADTSTTKPCADTLHKSNIPFVLLDSYIPSLNALSFYGQDSFCSGRFAARMLMLIAKGDKEIMIMKPMKDGKVASKQQDNREKGFRQFMAENYPTTVINELILPLDNNEESFDKHIGNYFASHPDTHNCITFCSKAYLIGEYLIRNNVKDCQILGYDMVARNKECVRKGSISFLIAQHAYMQGYHSVDSLFRHIVLKEKINPINYMPIEILNKENVEFYQRTMI